MLFSGTLRFNLDPFNTYSDNAIWDALALANLRSFVEEASSDGLEMTIAEGGNNLRSDQNSPSEFYRELVAVHLKFTLF